MQGKFDSTDRNIYIPRKQIRKGAWEKGQGGPKEAHRLGESY